MVISPTFDFSRAISSSRSSHSRSFKAEAAHSFPGPQDPAALRATDAPLWPSCAERKNASANFLRRPRGRLRQLWESAPAPLRASALHQSSSLHLRLRFNLPQPDVSLNRAAPQIYNDAATIGNNCTVGAICERDRDPRLGRLLDYLAGVTSTWNLETLPPATIW